MIAPTMVSSITTKTNKNNVIPVNAINICNLNLIEVLKNESIILKIDFDEFNITEYRRILKKLLHM